MSADNRAVATDALETLGTAPLPDSVGRDAIHLAVEPTIARERLKAGDHVDRNGGFAGKRVGIVDPFLRCDVNPGERFWLILYPRTITSLRHVWTSPDFPTRVPEVADAPR